MKADTVPVLIACVLCHPRHMVSCRLCCRGLTRSFDSCQRGTMRAETVPVLTACVLCHPRQAVSCLLCCRGVTRSCDSCGRGTMKAETARVLCHPRQTASCLLCCRGVTRSCEGLGRRGSRESLQLHLHGGPAVLDLTLVLEQKNILTGAAETGGAETCSNHACHTPLEISPSPLDLD